MKESPRRLHTRTGVGGGGALVVVGSSGDLARKRIIPAALSLRRKGLVPRSYLILGIDRRPPDGDPQTLGYRFLEGDFRSKNTFSALGRLLRTSAEGIGFSVTFYMATRPELFSGIIRRLKDEGLSRSKTGRRRILVEKPFGVDLESAQVLERTLRSAFPAGDVFRVDHFLGKAGTDYILRARFNSPRLEPVWNSRFIDHVQIIADERFDVGARGAFYDSTGVVRDMVQNHLLQLLCLVAMEPPVTSGPSGVASSKARVLRTVRMPGARQVVWGQYRGYNQADGVRRNTRTPTFAAMKVTVDNARWRGVPFYLRTGKALARTATQVVIVFRDSTPELTKALGGLSFLRVCIDPSAGVVVEAKGRAKLAGSEKPRRTPDEYESLLLDALRGDQARFVDARFNPLSWGLMGPLLDGWEGAPSLKPLPYEQGTWGPSSADSLIAADGRFWRDGRRGSLSS